jgi:protein-S-isoprenylcysteine O-methyltransferase Ste14
MSPSRPQAGPSRALVVALFVAAFGASLLASLLLSGQLMLAILPARWLGAALLILGAPLSLVGALASANMFHVKVDPVADSLVTTGPYRVVRHPIYLGLTLLLVGLALVTRSLVGLALAACLFFPIAVFRARREERALAERFPGHWREYADRSWFMLPGLW